MLSMGVIEESKSDWRNPIALVPKADGTVRVYIDFCKVSSLTKFDSYPVLQVDELLEWLGPAQYLSTVDLTKGY